MGNMPLYALGGAYPLWEAADLLDSENAGIRFQVRRDAVVYLFLPWDANPGALWSFVERRADINSRYYREGAWVYLRRFDAGAWVEVLGSPRGTIPPLIAVQERGPVHGDILIRRAETPETEFPHAESHRDPAAKENAADPPPQEEYRPGQVLTLEALTGPWQYCRRLPLRKRWFIHSGDAWVLLEGNQYTLPEEPDLGFIRIRLELYTPDGQVEYRTEKTIFLGD
jgi:hypothetical protein